MLILAWLPPHHAVEQPVSAPQGSGLTSSATPTPITSRTAPAGAPQPEAATPKPKTAPSATPVPASKPVSMRFPSVGLTLAIGEMRVVNGVIDPPTPDIGYWISNRGVMPASNAPGSVFAACHTWENGQKPCNKLYSPADPGQSIRPGALIIVRTQTGTLNYVVAHVQAVSKMTVAANQVSDVKCNVPDHLVVMTCVWPDNGQNFIVTAALQGRKYVAAAC
jgi:hypothetical protein